MITGILPPRSCPPPFARLNRLASLRLVRSSCLRRSSSALATRFASRHPKLSRLDSPPGRDRRNRRPGTAPKWLLPECCELSELVGDTGEDEEAWAGGAERGSTGVVEEADGRGCDWDRLCDEGEGEGLCDRNGLGR